MKRSHRLGMTIICAILILLAAQHQLASRPVHAQQSTQPPYEDGTFYIDSSVDVDSNYYLYSDSYMEVQFDFYEYIVYIEVDAQADEDEQPYYSDSGYGDDYRPAEVQLQSNDPVATGHEYGLDSEGYVCNDGGEGTCDLQYVGGVYATVYVQSPPPLISSVSPSSVTQGDQGTLTVSGTNFIEYSGDQLTLNFHGGNNPLISAPSVCTSSCTAKYSYDFTGSPAGTYTLSVSNNEGESDYESFTVVAAQASLTFPADTCAVTSSPKVGFASIVSTGRTGSGGTLSVSFSGAAFTNVNPTVTYGAYSTPSSIASNVAAVISAKYLQYGLSAKAFGPYIIYQGVAPLGAVSHSFADPSFTTNASSAVASATAAACYALPHIPCLGIWPDYDTAILYRAEGVTETPRQHIIRRHISNTASFGPPPTTVYVNPGVSVDFLFSTVQNYNRQTLFKGHPGKGGGIDYTFPAKTVMGVTFGVLGQDAAGNQLSTNHFVLSIDRCSVVTSYPIAP